MDDAREDDDGAVDAAGAAGPEALGAATGAAPEPDPLVSSDTIPTSSTRARATAIAADQLGPRRGGSAAPRRSVAKAWVMLGSGTATAPRSASKVASTGAGSMPTKRQYEVM